MTIDFDNDEQYRKFVRDVAFYVAEYNHADLVEDIADELSLWKYRAEIAQALLDRLLADKIKEANRENYQSERRID